MSFKALRSFLAKLGDYAVTRTVVILYCLALYLLVTSANLQVQAAFADLSGPWERVVASLLIAVGALLLFAVRPFVRTRYWLIPEAILFLAPTVIVGFLAPWSGGGDLSVVALVAGQALLMFFLAPNSRWENGDEMAYIGGIVIGVFVVLYTLFSLFPVHLPRDMGAPMVLTLFLALLALGVAILTRWPRWLFASVALVVASLLAYEFQHNAEYKPLQPYAGSNFGHADPFALWLFDRPDADYYRQNNLPYPVFLIASEGGGGYAMAHSFTFLSKMSERCPNFGQHVFAMVGVSGGQVGNTLFHANMNGTEQSEVAPCGDGAATRHTDYLATDHLTPLLAHFLFVEIPRKLLFLGASEKGRSHVLLESFNAVSNLYRPVADTAYWEHFWTFDENHDFYGYKLGKRPAIVSVTTNVETGNRFVFSPFPFETLAETNIDFFRFSGDLEGGEQRLIGPEIGSVALASASFPWVTPSLRFTTERAFNEFLDNPPGTPDDAWQTEGPIQRRSVNLVDGGYFENSSAETLSEIMLSITSDTVGGVSLSCSSREDVIWDGVDDDYAHRSLTQASPCAPSSGCAEIRGRPVARLNNSETWGACEVPFFVVSVLVRNTPAEFVTGGEQSFLADPIKTLLQSRTARGELAIAMLEERRCGFSGGSSCSLRQDFAGSGDPNPQIYMGTFQSLVNNAAMDLPLGWDMPAEKMDLIHKYTVPDADLCAPFLDPIGGVAFTDETGQAIAEPVELVLRRNCSHTHQMMRMFDADAIAEALGFRP